MARPNSQGKRHFPPYLVALTACILLVSGLARAAAATTVPRWVADLPGRPPVDVTLPVHLDGRMPREVSAFTLRTIVDVPPELQGRPLVFVLPLMEGLATLEVDGREAVAIDPPSGPSTYRATRPQRFRVLAEASQDGSLALALRVAYRSRRSAWLDGVPSLTTEPDGGSEATRVPQLNTAAAWFALAASVVVALLYGYLYLSMRSQRRVTHGWFALAAACGLAYPAYVLGLTQPVLGVYEATGVTLVLALGAVAAMFFARAYADAPPPSRAWWLALGAACVVGVVFRAPFDSLAVMTPVVLGLSTATGVAQILFVVRLRRERRDLPLSFLGVSIAWPAAALVALPDIAALLGQGEAAGGFRVGCVAIAVLCVYQAVALSREHLHALARADELVTELAERVRLVQSKHEEVELLNDELRRQIAARSRDLAEKLGDGSGPLPGPEAPPTFGVGDVVEGRYRIVEELGTGGMGTVYEVARLADGKHFAMKVLAGNGEAQHRARFAREAQIVAELDHPNVVSIVDVDLAESGFIFLVMELVKGGTTLHDVRRRHRDIPWTLGVLAQVADGLAAIHDKGIIHRDLKPANILLARGDDGRRPIVKITDFGIATLQPDGSRGSPGAMLARTAMSSLPPAEEAELEVDGSVARDTIPAPLTRTGIIFGTPQYMAQELAYGTKHATRASDVFALGILAFEVLTGKRPFKEGPVAAKLDGRPLPVAPRFRKVCPTLAVDVARVLDAAMSHVPEERPTAKEISETLRAAQGRLQL